ARRTGARGGGSTRRPDRIPVRAPTRRAHGSHREPPLRAGGARGRRRRAHRARLRRTHRSAWREPGDRLRMLPVRRHRPAIPACRVRARPRHDRRHARGPLRRDVAAVREQSPGRRRPLRRARLAVSRAYLDHASSSPLREACVEAMLPYLYSHHADPGRLHAEGRTTRVAIEEAREAVAALFGARPREVVFTSSGTEAVNTAVWGALARSG